MQTVLIPGHPNYRAVEDGRIQKLGLFGFWYDCPLNVNSVTGYVTVSMDGQSYSVHRLILEAFVGPCPEGHECRHYPDFDKQNNAISNLSWAPRAVNLADRRLNYGEDNHQSALTNDQAKAIFLLRRMFTVAELSSIFAVSEKTIRQIHNRKTYTKAIEAIPQSTANLRRWVAHGI